MTLGISSPSFPPQVKFLQRTENKYKIEFKTAFEYRRTGILYVSRGWARSSHYVAEIPKQELKYFGAWIG